MKLKIIDTARHRNGIGGAPFDVMVFNDGEVMDGVMPNNLLSWDTAGFAVTPPEPDGNNQKVFVPRQALKSIQVLGVVGSPLRGKRKKAAPGAEQPTLF